MLTTTQMATVKLFEGSEHATQYATFRPTYPDSVMEIILSFMREHNCSGFNTAVDVACGSGQSTFLLSNHFQSILGVDISEAQISKANVKCNEIMQGRNQIKFAVDNAYNIPAGSSTVDLLTCAMGWHWLDPEQFYAEANRVLKTRGCLAVYGYGATVDGNERISNILERFKTTVLKEGCYNKRVVHVFNEYEACTLPFQTTMRKNFTLPQESTVDQFIGFLSSLSVYKTYCEKVPNNTLLQDLKLADEEEFKEEDEESCISSFAYPGFSILGVKE